MVALDLDGTTLNSEREITPRTIAAFEECKRKGVHIVVSTGRTYSTLPENVTGAPGIEYAITSNGAHINYIKTGEAIYDNFLAPSAVEEVARLKVSTNAYIEVFIDGIAYTDESYYEEVRLNGCEYRSAEYVLWSRRPVPDITRLMLENKERIENVNFIYPTLDMLEMARPAVEAMENATITSSFPNNLEVGGPTTSKKTALIELMSRLGIDKSELMCCGDAPNDIQMIEMLPWESLWQMPGAALRIMLTL
ncbi:MAG: HAD-IIB family hydrolase [Mogibacterium sp.]|nr:HAD-IIB family hydrolase [Mogibacterium sp.]